MCVLTLRISPAEAGGCLRPPRVAARRVVTAQRPLPGVFRRHPPPPPPRRPSRRPRQPPPVGPRPPLPTLPPQVLRLEVGVAEHARQAGGQQPPPGPRGRLNNVVGHDTLVPA